MPDGRVLYVVPPTDTVSSSEQLLNALSPSTESLEPDANATVVRDELLLNADEPMLVTDAGIERLLIFVQPVNADLPIVVSDVENFAPASVIQPENALSSISTTLLRSMVLFVPLPAKNEQPLNALFPIYLMLEPRSTDVRVLLLENIPLPILVIKLSLNSTLAVVE